MDEKKAEALAAIFGGESWDSGGGIYLAAYHRGDGAYIVFSGDAVCEYADEDAFEDGNATKMITLASGTEEWWVVQDDKGNTFYQHDELEIGWRDQGEAERQARYLQSREGGKYFAKQVQ